jgi:hypothetical protein
VLLLIRPNATGLTSVMLNDGPMTSAPADVETLC